MMLCLFVSVFIVKKGDVDRSLVLVNHGDYVRVALRGSASILSVILDAVCHKVPYERRDWLNVVHVESFGRHHYCLTKQCSGVRWLAHAIVGFSIPACIHQISLHARRGEQIVPRLQARAQPRRLLLIT